jgi:hypothetical protein
MLRVPAIATAIVVALVALYVVAGVVAGARKLEAVRPPPAARGDYAITLAFAPERFHEQWLQDRGRVVGGKGSTVFMRDVEPQALRGIAREYWVTGVTRWSGP